MGDERVVVATEQLVLVSAAVFDLQALAQEVSDVASAYAADRQLPIEQCER